MTKRVSFLILSFFVISIMINAQVSRTTAMGDLSYVIEDQDNSLNLFDFGKNPAWLINDEKGMRLDISPFVSNSWGSYRQKFSPYGISSYGVGVMGVRPLGEAGTFRGLANYHSELRRKNCRTLKKDTYAGEAFFFVDTTDGDFEYNGPTFEFMHSLELFKKVYVGASVRYQIWDGLKQVFSYAETLFRRISGDIGVAYKIDENFSIGSNFTISDGQERIEAKDVNLRSIDSYIYYGDTYRTLDRGGSVDHKLKKKGNSFGVQIHWQPDRKTEIGIKSRYHSANTAVLIDETKYLDDGTQQTLKDFEEGYSDFEDYSIQLKARYNVSPEFMLGFSSSYINNSSWSKNSELNLLLWEWDVKETALGVGASYKFKPASLLVGIEYEYSNTDADSSKYIDNKYCSLKSTDHLIKAGMEFEPLPNLFIRAGYNFASKDHDFIIGGDNVTYNLVTVGVGFGLFDSIVIDMHVEYLDTSLDKNSKIKWSKWSGITTIRLFTF